MKPDDLQLTAQSRVLFLAPHPDDESLAGGALLQRAAAAGAAVRVLFATNGDNNPWPQRFVDRRWSVGSNERKRWGARRRQEARDALCVLGLSEGAGEFLGFPDQGFSSALLRADTKVLDTFTNEIRDWQPTLLVLPSPHDIHPDHNALAVIFDIALRRLPVNLRPRVLHFPVHPYGTNADGADITLHLTDTEVRRKRRAILCHETQMALSQRRFLRYATTEEYFLSDAWSRAEAVRHPIREVALINGALRVRLHARWRVAAPRLLIAAGSVLDESARWEVPLLQKSGTVRMSECVTERPLRLATIRKHEDMLEVRIPLAPLQPLAYLFVKLERRLAFYDHAGWVRVPLAVNDLATSVDETTDLQVSTLSNK